MIWIAGWILMVFFSLTIMEIPGRLSDKERESEQAARTQTCHILRKRTRR